MNKIIDLSIAYWRLEKWVCAAPVERKMAAESSLRTIREFLDENKVKVIDLTGQPYDQGLSVEVMYYEDEDSEDDKTPVITEMMSPIIIQDGNVIKFGQVVIAKNPNCEDVSKEEPIEETSPIEIDLLQNNNIEPESKKNESPNYFYKILLLASCILLILNVCFTGFAVNKLNGELTKATSERAKLQQTVEEISNRQEENVQNTIAPEEEKSISWKAYCVQSGDSLVSICAQNNISYDAWERIIISINGIEDINKIYVGQVILLPRDFDNN